MDAETGKIIATGILQLLFTPFSIVLLLSITRELLVND